MNWLQPAWLFAVGAVLLPILVHLWGRGRGREVVVASLRWFPEGTSRSVRRFRPSDGWLLLVRCFLLAALALAMAQPRALVPPRAGSATWVLVEPRVLELAAGPERLDRMRREHPQAEVRWFLPGAPAWVAGEPAPNPSRWLEDQWAVVRNLDRLAPPGVQFVLLTTDRLVALRGSRPATDRRVTWETLEVSGPAERSIDSGNPGGRRVTGPEGTRLVRTEADPNSQTAELLVGVISGPDRNEDAAIVVRAIEHLQEQGWSVRVAESPSRAPVRIELGASIGSSAGDPSALGASGEVVWRLRDGTGAERTCRGIVYPRTLEPRPFATLRCLSPVPGAVQWTAPDGEPLLTQARDSDGVYYHFASRLHPSWSTLESVEWARWLGSRWMADGVLPREMRSPGFDRRRAFVGEQLPQRPLAAESDWRPQPKPGPERIGWCLVALLLVAERWMQWRRT